MTVKIFFIIFIFVFFIPLITSLFLFHVVWSVNNLWILYSVNVISSPVWNSLWSFEKVLPPSPPSPFAFWCRSNRLRSDRPIRSCLLFYWLILLFISSLSNTFQFLFSLSSYLSCLISSVFLYSVLASDFRKREVVFRPINRALPDQPSTPLFF